ncbi:glycosyltransferase [archaeon]|nr:glycosyltransferase [archaeon]
MIQIIRFAFWIMYGLALYFSIFFFIVFIEVTSKPSKKTHFSKLKKFPKITIAVPAYNEEANIANTINSILKINYTKEKMEVFILDDGSTDKTKKIANKFSSKQIKIISHKNMGKAASLNKALKIAKGEFFICLDADSYVEPNTLQKMLYLYYSSKNPKLAVITPALKVKDPKTLLQKVQWIEYLVTILTSRLSSHIDTQYVAPGPFSMYKTSILRKLKGFDVKNITEDQEIAYRIQINHYIIKQCQDAFVHTVSPKNLKAFARQRNRWYIGTLQCLNQYKGMLMNKKYGDFGIIQMFKNLTGFIIATSTILLSLIFIIIPLITKLIQLSWVNFDTKTFSKIATGLPTTLYFDVQLLFIVFILSFLGWILYYYSHKNSGEKILGVGLLPIVPYFLIYYSIKGGVMIYSILEYLIKKKTKW